MTQTLTFLLDGEVIELSDIDPTTTVLEWLRYHRGRTGTKEGCAEGDCGACTVVIGTLSESPSPRLRGEGRGEGPLAVTFLTLDPDQAIASLPSPPPHLRGEGRARGGEPEGSLSESRITYRALNACILFIPMLHGKALITVESLNKHPVQQALITLHGSQCGFCTPGIVMSLYARTLGATGTTNTDPKDVLAGNLCRCTGYGPILDAAKANPFTPPDDAELTTKLQSLQNNTPLHLPGWTTPQTADQLAQTLTERPDARIVAGATDVGLWVTKHHRSLPDIVYIGDIPDLSQIEETPHGLTLGATARYSDAHDALTNLHPSLGELVRRIGAVQVRNSGTIGGNIANGSPIGDMPPALIALGATVTLRKGPDRRTLPLEDFFIAYGRQDRAPGEFVETLHIPKPSTLYRVVKLSKRFDSDISAVCGAFNLTLDNGTITAARIAFGGMAGTPKRSPACEAALTGQPWSQATLEAAAQALTTDYQPLTDVRGSADYRLASAANLVRKLWFDGTSVLDVGAIHA